MDTRELKEIIEKNTNISTLKIKEGLEELAQTGKFLYKDGQIVKFIGVINSIKKKYTKKCSKKRLTFFVYSFIIYKDYMRKGK